MAALTIQDVSRRSGLSEPTLRYYEQVGLIGPIERDESSGHRRYREDDVDTLQALACLRAMGVGIEDMRTYQANRATEEIAGPEPPRLIIHNDRAKQELGWRPRPAETTIVETAESLRDLGLLEK